MNPEDVKPILEHVENSVRTEAAAEEKPADEDKTEAEGDDVPEVKRGFGGRFQKKA